MCEYKGNYIVVVEGNVLLNEDGMFCILVGELFLEKLKCVSVDVKVIIVWGFCVLWGCVQVVCFNLIKVMLVYKLIIDNFIIKVSGCLFIFEVMFVVIIYMLVFDCIFFFDCFG